MRECRKILARQITSPLSGGGFLTSYCRTEDYGFDEETPGDKKVGYSIEAARIAGLISIETGRFQRRSDDSGLRNHRTFFIGKPYVALKCNRCPSYVSLGFNWDDDVPLFTRQPLCPRCRGASLRGVLGWRGLAFLVWRRLFRPRAPKILLSGGPYR